MYPKKNFVRGVVRGMYIIVKNYVERGVKTGINYPHTWFTTCIRVIKIPLYPPGGKIQRLKSFSHPISKVQFFGPEKQLKDA